MQAGAQHDSLNASKLGRGKLLNIQDSRIFGKLDQDSRRFEQSENIGAQLEETTSGMKLLNDPTSKD